MYESRKSITHYEPWDAPEYQAGDFDSYTLVVKYNLSKNKLTIVKYEADYNTFSGQKRIDIENDIKKYLSSKGLDGRVVVKFKFRKRKVVVRHNGKLLAEQEIKPKLIVVNASTK